MKKVAGNGAASSAAVSGTSLVVSEISAGTIPSTAGEAIAFLPNELGRALLSRQVSPVKKKSQY